MEMIWVKVEAEDGELGVGGMRQIEKDGKKKKVWFLFGLKVHFCFLLPQKQLEEEAGVNVTESLGVNHSGYRWKQEEILKVMSSSKLKLLARSRMGARAHYLNSSALCSSRSQLKLGTLRWEFTLRRSEELRTPKNSHQVSLVAQTAKWQTHTCVGGSSDPLGRVQSAEETGKEAAGQSRGGRPSSWAAALPSCPRSSSGISRSGRSRGGLPRHSFVCPCPFYFLCPLCKRSPATAPLPPKNLPPRPSLCLSTNPENCFTPRGDPVTGATCLSPSFFLLLLPPSSCPQIVLALC